MLNKAPRTDNMGAMADFDFGTRRISAHIHIPAA